MDKRDNKMITRVIIMGLFVAVFIISGRSRGGGVKSSSYDNSVLVKLNRLCLKSFSLEILYKIIITCVDRDTVQFIRN